jgi:hypothetical protein
MTNPLYENLELEKKKLDEALFGLDEEIDTETADDILDLYGINCEKLVTDFKLLIQEEIRKENGKAEKKKEVENLLSTLKDISNYQRANDAKQIEPKTLIQGLLDGTFLPNLKPSWDFRNKSDDGLSENDKEILKDLDEE